MVNKKKIEVACSVCQGTGIIEDKNPEGEVIGTKPCIGCKGLGFTTSSSFDLTDIADQLEDVHDKVKDM